MMTSLMSGLPRRDTCVQGPAESFGCPYILDIWRLADVHTPIVEWESVYDVGWTHPRVSSLIGTWIAMLCTFRLASELMPAVAAPFRRKSGWNGRSSPRSKIDPRST